jgi:hypothetical protein
MVETFRLLSRSHVNLILYVYTILMTLAGQRRASLANLIMMARGHRPDYHSSATTDRTPPTDCRHDGPVRVKLGLANAAAAYLLF